MFPVKYFSFRPHVPTPRIIDIAAVCTEIKSNQNLREAIRAELESLISGCKVEPNMSKKETDIFNDIYPVVADAFVKFHQFGNKDPFKRKPSDDISFIIEKSGGETVLMFQTSRVKGKVMILEFDPAARPVPNDNYPSVMHSCPQSHGHHSFVPPEEHFPPPLDKEPSPLAQVPSAPLAQQVPHPGYPQYQGQFQHPVPPQNQVQHPYPVAQQNWGPQQGPYPYSVQQPNQIPPQYHEQYQQHGQHPYPEQLPYPVAPQNWGPQQGPYPYPVQQPNQIPPQYHEQYQQHGQHPYPEQLPYPVQHPNQVAPQPQQKQSPIRSSYKERQGHFPGQPPYQHPPYQGQPSRPQPQPQTPHQPAAPLHTPYTAYQGYPPGYPPRPDSK